MMTEENKVQKNETPEESLKSSIPPESTEERAEKDEATNRKYSTVELEEIYKKIRKFATDNPVKAHNILVREFGMTSRRADQIVKKIRKQEENGVDLKDGISYVINLGLMEDNFISKIMKEMDKGGVKSGEIRKSMDNLCEALEDEIISSNFSDDAKKKMMERLRRFTTTKTNIMLVGATGSGKSSTINALFSVNPEDNGQDASDDYHYVEVAKVGTKSDPETKVIEKYTIGNLTLWDTPGLGDTIDEDESHTDVIEELLDEEDDEGNALIDLVLVVLDGSTRDLGTSYRILNDIILPRFEDEPDRVLVALNQADIAMKTGRHWNYEKNEPDETLIAFLEDKVRSIHDRILEDTGIEVDPIYYCAGYMEEETGEVVRPYNLSKLLLYIMNSIPPIKRIAVFEGLNTDSENYEHNDDDEDYSSAVFSSFEDIVDESVEGGIDLGMAILGVPGAIVGGVVGAAVGVIRGLFDKIFG